MTAVQDKTLPRRSLGGQVVESSLVRAGYRVGGVPGVTLVETAPPRREPYSMVLAQNAWNVIPRDDLLQRLREYPHRMWSRILSRRALAHVNLRRAGQVVCLTQAMADMCARYARDVRVAPVTVPMDLLAADAPDAPAAPPFAPGTLLVPGTVTWYKDPAAAVRLFVSLSEQGAGITSVLFGGSADGSGCWPAVQQAAQRAQIPHSRRSLGRQEMRAACEHAEVVVVASRLESLSFSLAESLLLARSVVASRIPAHVEVASRMGREPQWLTGGEDHLGSACDRVPSSAGRSHLVDEWIALGIALGLPLAPVGELG